MASQSITLRYTNILDTSVVERPITTELRCAFLNRLWGTNLTAQYYETHRKILDVYFDDIVDDLSGPGASGGAFAAVTYSRVLGIIETLKQGDLTKDELIHASIPAVHQGSAELVTFAAKLLIPLNIAGIGRIRPGKVEWRADMTLRQLIENTFPPTAPSARNGMSRCAHCDVSFSFASNFTLYHLERLAGIHINWTSNLADHLRLVDNGDTVQLNVFHQVSLLAQLAKLDLPVLPAALAIETIQSISLLLPRRQKAVRHWFRNRPAADKVDPALIECSHLKPSEGSIEHFDIWQSRLRELRAVYNDHEPQGALQWWRDDRRPVQWWTFWIAALVLLLTVVFGVIQCVTGILQVVKSN